MTRLPHLTVLGTVLFLGAFGCAATPPPEPQAAGAPTTETRSASTEAPAKREVVSESEAPVVCDLICEQAKVERRQQDDPDYHAQATANANQVLGAMSADLLACYTKRIKSNPNAHGFLTVDIIIGPDGKVVDVLTTGGAILGEQTMGCLTGRIRKAQFAAPHGGGTLRISVPFSLRRVAAGEEA